MKSNVINHIKNILSDKRTSLAIMLLAIGSRVIQLVYFFNIRVDGSFQVMATQSFVQGHGVSVAKVFPENLSATIYEPLINWPPGYSLLLTPFYLFFGNDYAAAGLTLDILSGVTLLIVTRKLLSLFNLPVYILNLFTLFACFFLYFFYVIASSDAIGITFFLIALHTALLLFKDGDNRSSRLFLLCITLVIFAFLKYLFIPVAFILPIVLLICGICSKNVQLKSAGIISLFIIGISVGGLLTYQKIISGTATYISSPDRGFFPQHLTETYPFIPASFLQPSTFQYFTGNATDRYDALYSVFQWLHLLILLLFIGIAFRAVYQSRFKNVSLTSFYFYVAILVGVSISGLLSFLSLTVSKEQILPGLFWTYVEEARYYGLPQVLIHLGLFICYQYIREKKFWLRKYAMYILLLLLLPETFRGIIFDTNRLLNFNKEEYSWQYEKRLEHYADQLIKKKKKELSVEKVVVTGSSYMNSRVSLHNNLPIMEAVERINNPASIHTQEPVLLVIILYHKDVGEFSQFLADKQATAAGYFEGFQFYTMYVTPN